jgi:hypothetical protein
MDEIAGDKRLEPFRVEPWVDWFGGAVARWPGLWHRLGDFETRRFADALVGRDIEAPIFVCGLARSGSTVLLESLAAHPDTATHRYRDYPGVLAPIFWDQVSMRLYGDRQTLKERAHGDGIAVTPDSPEAMEEILWMAFFPDAHDPARDNRIESRDLSPAFAAFYRDHIRKLLWLREGSRYLSKGNYNLARLGGLLALFPDARFVVPVRDPVTHIASLMRQHELFAAAEARYPAALRYMQRVGHFEFGLDRRPLNLGDNGATTEIQRLWRDGRDIEGWSRYWASVHDFVADLSDNDPVLREAMLVVRFEDLCADPVAMLERIFAHVRLDASAPLMATLAARIRAPSYYALPFTDDEQAAIRRLTGGAARRFGY